MVRSLHMNTVATYIVERKCGHGA